MNAPTHPTGRGPDERGLRDALRDVEGLLDCTFSDPGVDAAIQAAAQAELRDAVAELRAAVAREPQAAAALRARIEKAEARHALRVRDVPSGALDGLYESVRARTADGDRWLRAGMSSGFLDAPRSLTVWRRTAVAACALLALGLGSLWAGGFDTNGSEDAPAGPAQDARDELLQRLRPVEARHGGGAIVPVRAGGLAEPTPRGGMRWQIYRLSPDGSVDTQRLLDGVIRMRRIPVAPASVEPERN